MIKKCSGCGVKLQNKDAKSYGYAISFDSNLCERCFRIKHYNEYKRVSFNNDDYLKIINSINKSDDLVLYVVSLFGTKDLVKLRNIIKGKNVILVLSKRDIFPKSIKDSKLISYVNKLDLNLLDVIVVSSIKEYNIDLLYKSILMHKTSKKVYVSGMTNSGKSTLINKLISKYGVSNSNVTCSMYPNTTLDSVEVVLNDDVCLIDTPGIIDDYSIMSYLSVDEMKLIGLKNRIRPRIYQVSKGCSFVINDILRIDYLSDKKNNLIFYLSNDLKIVRCGLANTKLKDKKMYSFPSICNKDIVIDDFFFCTVTCKCNIEVYVNYMVDVYERDRLI